MSTGGPNAIEQKENLVPTPEVSKIEKNEKTILEVLKEKFSDVKGYVLQHKQAFANIGQIVGTAGLVAGGASLLFSGIAANLTIAGIPLGIPLMVAGSILFLVGTALQVAHHVEKEGGTVAEKLKSFFKETLANLTFGTIAGAGVIVACSLTSLTNLIAIVAVAIKFKPLLFAKPNEWKEAVSKIYSESGKVNGIKKGSIEEKLKNSESFSDFVKKLTEGIPEAVKGIVDTFDQSSASRLANIFPSEDPSTGETMVQTLTATV